MWAGSKDGVIKVPHLLISIQLGSSCRTVVNISMSSFIIQSHVGHKVPLAWTRNDTCPFCLIISGELPAQKVYETEKVIAILGIHLLISLQ